MEIKDLIFTLCGKNGINETSAADFAFNYLAAKTKTERDVSGNIIATFQGRNDYTILIDAHIDEIGFVVTAITEEGFVKVGKSGGYDLRVILAQEVIVFGKEPVYGVVSCMPPHLLKDNAEKAPDIDQVFIDVGLTKDEAEKVVAPGDFVSVKIFPRMLLNRQVTAAGLDNRAGVSALLKLSDMLETCSSLSCTVVLLLSNQEELGCRGALPAAFKITPDESIVVDVSFSADPHTPPHKSGKLGGGAMIGISPVLSKEMSDRLVTLSKENEFNYQIEVMGGSVGTNADVISTSRKGVRTAMLSIPVKNMHTPVEVADLSDIQTVAGLLFDYVTKGGLTYA